MPGLPRVYARVALVWKLSRYSVGYELRRVRQSKSDVVSSDVYTFKHYFLSESVNRRLTSVYNAKFRMQEIEAAYDLSYYIAHLNGIQFIRVDSCRDDFKDETQMGCGLRPCDGKEGF